ncbi:MAG: DUF4276 family protein [Spirulina sp. SIO3F2]|nr:DUF4276 family protein [Spirulina sp. SIO3F2]
MSESCYYFTFLLFVTGKGEREHLPKLFKELTTSGICSFKVVEKIGQRRAITSPRRIAKMVGKGQMLPSKDFEQIGAPARRHLQNAPCARLLLIDDLEGLDEADASAAFQRYRRALDEGLREHKERAAVHFLVRMLEAYFFADVEATNQALALDPPIPSYDQDVETTIEHPKSELKQQYFPQYREIEDSGKVLGQLSLNTVLASPERCASLRTCVKWIVEQLMAYPTPNYVEQFSFDERFHLQTGQLYVVTENQEITQHPGTD